MSTSLQLLGTTLRIFGWLGIISCALPLRHVTAFIGTNIVTAQIMWEGLWLSCVVQSTGQMQCKVYDSILARSQDLQDSRAILIIASLVGLMAIFASFAGGKCTNCLPDGFAKACVAVAGGAAFVTVGVLGLVPSLDCPSGHWGLLQSSIGSSSEGGVGSSNLYLLGGSGSHADWRRTPLQLLPKRKNVPWGWVYGWRLLKTEGSAWSMCDRTMFDTSEN